MHRSRRPRRARWSARSATARPFVIGSRNRVQMTAAGQLFLGVNDGHLQDNEGAFQVQVAREGGAIRR